MPLCRRTAVAAALATLTFLQLQPRASQACSFAVSEIAPNDPAEEGLDNTPPVLISVDIESLSRTTGPVFDIDEDGNVLGGYGSSCDGHSFLNLNVEAADDRSELS